MQMRHIVTGALAWTGLVVVIAVPSAEAVLSRLAHSTAIAHVQPADIAVAPPPAPAAIAPQLSATAEVATAPATRTAPAIRQAAITKPIGAPAPIVELDSARAAKPLPGPADSAMPGPNATGEAKASPAPRIVAKTTAAADTAEPVTTGSAPAARTDPVSPDRAPPAQQSATDLPTPGAAAGETMASVKRDGVVVATGEAASAGLTDGLDVPPARPPVPMPAADRPKPPPARVVTADELGGWKSGSLADYLRRQNLANPAASAPDSQN